eukprot:gene20223-26975_t
MSETNGGAAIEPAAAATTAEENPCPQKERAWAHFRSLGSPKYMVAPMVDQKSLAWAGFCSLGSTQYRVDPMVDQSELPFRMLCRAHGATAAYTPMFHARLFAEDKRYK